MGREREGCSSCCVQDRMVSGRELGAAAEQGGWMGDTPAGPLPAAAAQSLWGPSVKEQPCTARPCSPGLGSWLLGPGLLLEDNVFCWAERCPGRAALFEGTTSRACCGQSSSCIHSSLAPMWCFFNCASCSAFGTISFPCHKHWN